jgi:hypothetical protein
MSLQVPDRCKKSFNRDCLLRHARNAHAYEHHNSEDKSTLSTKTWRLLVCVQAQHTKDLEAPSLLTSFGLSRATRSEIRYQDSSRQSYELGYRCQPRQQRLRHCLTSSETLVGSRIPPSNLHPTQKPNKHHHSPIQSIKHRNSETERSHTTVSNVTSSQARLIALPKTLIGQCFSLRKDNPGLKNRIPPHTPIIPPSQ